MNTLYIIAKRSFERIPMLKYLAALMCGILLGGSVGVSGYWLAAGLLVLVVLLGLSFFTMSEWVERAVVVATVVVAFVFGAVYVGLRTADMIEVEGRGRLVGRVERVNKSADGRMQFVVVADSIVGEEFEGSGYRGLVYSEYDEGIKKGNLIAADCRYFVMERQPYSSFDSEGFMRHKGYSFAGRVDEVEVRDRAEALDLKDVTRERLRRSGVSVLSTAFLMNVMLGDRTGMPNDVYDDFADCGIVHILAVSGLHVGIIYTLLLGVVGRVFRRNFYVSRSVIILFVWLYVGVCGFSPSAMRAAIMITVRELSFMLGARSNEFISMSVAAMVILIVDPHSLYSIGFWLSFIAVWGILVLGRWMIGLVDARRRFLRKFVWEPLTVSVSAQIATTPVTLLCFHRFPTYFLVHNLVLVWLVSYVIIFGALTAVIGMPGFWADGVDWVVGAMIRYAQWAASWPMASVEGVPMIFAEMALLLVALWLAGNWVQKERVGTATMAALIAFVLLRWGLAYKGRQESEILVWDKNVTAIEGGKARHILTSKQTRWDERTMADIEREKRVERDTAEVCEGAFVVAVEGDTLLVCREEDDLEMLHEGWRVLTLN